MKFDDEDLIYRRIPPGSMVPDENYGGDRLMSNCFQNYRREDRLSGASLALLNRYQMNPHDLLVGHEGFGLTFITVGQLTEEFQQTIEHDPLPDNPAHVHVIGAKNKTRQKRMAYAATPNIIILPA